MWCLDGCSEGGRVVSRASMAGTYAVSSTRSRASATSAMMPGEWRRLPAFLCAGAVSLLTLAGVTTLARGADRPSLAGAPPSGIERVRSIATGLRHAQVLSVSLVAFFLQVVHHMGYVLVLLYAPNVGLSLSAIGRLRNSNALVNRPRVGLASERTV